MDDSFIPAHHPPSANTDPAWWFVISEHKLMVRKEGEALSVPFLVDPKSLGLMLLRERYLGTLAGRHCYCADVAADAPVPEEMGFYGLRYLFGHLTEPMFTIAMKAVHLVEWEEATCYCGRCGGLMAPGEEMNARRCNGCGLTVFPRISPAVIVLVQRDGQVLLARASRFTSDLYSVLAGFVEPGETLEDAVHREIEEEVGIKVGNVRYFGSQPWPFPDSLMIGFTADYVSGEINIDNTEIVAAGWFHPDKLPSIPGRVSIARKLIDWFIMTRGGGARTGPPAEKVYDPGE